MGKGLQIATYMEYTKIDSMSTDVYRYLNFDRMPEYKALVATAKNSVAQAQ